jgi:FixJ family two-component response regulator
MIRQNGISIIDDDELILASVDSLLRSYGYHTLLFNSAEQYIKLGTVYVTDCMISDIKMPGMNGLSMYDSFLDIRPPVIFITTSTASAPRIHAYTHTRQQHRRLLLFI